MRVEDRQLHRPTLARRRFEIKLQLDPGADPRAGGHERKRAGLGNFPHAVVGIFTPIEAIVGGGGNCPEKRTTIPAFDLLDPPQSECQLADGTGAVAQVRVTVPRPAHILVPTDFSDASKEAALYGAMLAEAFGATLHVIHVIPDPIDLGWAVDAAYLPQFFDRTERTARDQLNSQLTADEATRCRARYVVEVGSPARKIIDYAATHGIDLIVMGTHGRGALEKLWVGSVTHAVLLKAPCPVVSVQHPPR